jgi:hypothetical protein
MTAIVPAATAIETEIGETVTAEIAIATFGVMVRAIRAATVARGVRIPGITAMMLAGLMVALNPSATPAARAAMRLARNSRLAKSKRLAKSRRLGKTKRLAPAMKPSVPPTSAVSAANGAAEVAVAAAGADVTAGKTPRMARAPTNLKERVRPTISLALLRPIQARLQRPRRHPFTSVRPSVPRLNRFVNSRRP